MKQFLRFLIPLLLLIALNVAATAATEATHVTSNNTVSHDGSCSVSLTVQLHLDAAATDILFPLPDGAEDVYLNGTAIAISYRGQQAYAPLPSLNVGDYSFTLAYRIADVVSESDGVAIVTVPLLSGFAYPIRSMDFSVTLPGDITGPPLFISGYHKEDIESVIRASVSGSTVSATVQQSLKDHETLVMILEAPEDMFPFVIVLEPLMDGWDAAVLICIVLAIVYYLLTLMPRIYRRSRCFSVPDGISAGEMGTCLTGAGVDLTLMVFSWAQLGYIQIHYQNRHRVLLHKVMEMGNERSQFEVRIFQALFKGRSTVDGTGMHYARLCRKTASKAPMLRQLFMPNSGRPMIFRLLSCAAGILSGVKLGLALTDNPALQILLTVMVCFVCGAFSYFIQAGGKCLPLRDKTPLWVALGCSALWVALGYMAGMLTIAIPMVLFQLIAGIAIAFGGHRSELGKRCLSQITGLRHHMVRANTFELQQRLQANSSYFYELAPYALALGVDKRFARRFGKSALPDCSFLMTDGKEPSTTSEWATLLRQTADALNARQRRLPYGSFAVKK